MKAIDSIDLLDRMRGHGVPADTAGIEAFREADLYFYGPDDTPTRWLVANRAGREWMEAQTAEAAMVRFTQKYAKYQNYDVDFFAWWGLLFIASPIYFEDEIPPCAVPMRSTAVLVKAGLMKPSIAKMVNKQICGKAIV